MDKIGVLEENILPGIGGVSLFEWGAAPIQTLQMLPRSTEREYYPACINFFSQPDEDFWAE